MYSNGDVLSLVSKIYESAADPLCWDDFLADVARVSRSTIAALAYNDGRRHEHFVSAQFGIAPEHQRLYAEHYGAVDEWTRGAPGVARTGWVGTGHMLVPDSAFARSEFYNDFLRHSDDAFHQCSAVLSQQGSAWGTVALVRPRKAGPFAESDLRLLRVLLPHLQRAMQLHQRFVDLRRQSNILESALDLVAAAILFIDASGHVIAANRSADALLKRGDSLLSTHDGLRAASPRESTQLRQLIRTSALTGNGKGLFHGGVMEISREAPRPPLALLVAPIRTAFPRLTPHRPVAVVFVTDPEQEVKPSSEILRRLYGVTPAEFEVAALLAQGCSVRQAAEIQRVTVATVRSQLKSIFRKTNVSSQSQLVRLLMLMPPAVSRGGRLGLSPI